MPWLNRDGHTLLLAKVLRSFGYGYLPVVLAVYNWSKENDRFRRVQRFIDYFYLERGLLFGLGLLLIGIGLNVWLVWQWRDANWGPLEVQLTMRWALFFLLLAVLNEIVARTQSTNFWVNFKFFGVVPLTFIFAFAQYPLLAKYAVQEPAEAKD